MQREIKFRGKMVDDVNKWVYGDVAFLRAEGISEILAAVIERYIVIPETVGQYTGINDSKRTKEYPDGQPIYEGDILQINIMDWNRAGNITASGRAAVEYRGCTFGVEWGFSRDFTGLDSFSNNCSLEIIGNIHDHQELLEEGAEPDGRQC